MTILSISLKNQSLSLTSEELNALLLRSCMQGDLQSVKMLLTTESFNVNIHHNDDHALVLACMHGHLEIARFLLTSELLAKDTGQAPMARHANIHAKDDLPLRWACENGDLAMVAYLLASPEITQVGGSHANVHARQGQCLINACIHGHIGVVAYLLKNSQLKDCPLVHEEALIASCEYGQLQSVKYLFEESGLHMDICAKRHAAFKKSCREGHLPILQYLLAYYKACNIANPFVEEGLLWRRD